jgi:predicted GH43/DUF377 family glycosyl hydrolase
MYHWQKRGVLWKPDNTMAWAQNYATCPTPLKLDNLITRIYFQSRDKTNVGRIGYIDVLSSEPSVTVNVSKRPVLDVGTAGTFDDSGVFQCSIVKIDDDNIFLYYAGFELLQKTRYRILTGLAISQDGGETFQRVRDTPILERSNAELHVRGGPSVIFEANKFKMWYVAGSKWETINNKNLPVYSIKYLESNDGIHWSDEGKTIFEPRADEHGFGRPSVYVTDDNEYEMIFSVRKRESGYRMGYARSRDGLNWIRMDQQFNLDVSTTGPDDQSIEFGALLPSPNRRTLIYNGNDYGQTGLLWAQAI